MSPPAALLRKAFSLLRLQAFDTDNAQGRADERYRRALFAMLANAGNKALALAVMVLSVSLTAPYLGPERLGAWMLISSLSFVLAFLGLGVGNALTNKVALAHAQECDALLANLVSGGLGFMACIALGVGALLQLVFHYLPWDQVLRSANGVLVDETKQAAAVFGLFFATGIFNSALNGIFAGLQKSYLAHASAALGSVLALIGLWFAAHAQSDIATLVLVSFGVQTLASLGLLLVLHRGGLLRLRGLVTHTKHAIPGLWRDGGLFFLLQVGGMIATGADALIVSSLLGAAQVAVLGVAQRLLLLVSQPLSIFNTPFWGAYADALAREDYAFVRKTLRWSLLLTLGAALLGAVVVSAVSAPVIALWTGAKVAVPMALFVACALWTVLECLGGALAMFLNGAGIVREQTVVVAVFCTVLLPLKIWAVGQWGLLAVPLSAALVYLLTHLLAYGYVYLPTIQSIATGQQPATPHGPVQ